MAISYSTIFKALAPYLAQVAADAIPAFTPLTHAFKSDSVLSKQIDELQVAVTQNASSIHILAIKIQQAIDGIEESAQEAKKQLTFYKTMLFVSLSLSVVSLAICVYLLVR